MKSKLMKYTAFLLLFIVVATGLFIYLEKNQQLAIHLQANNGLNQKSIGILKQLKGEKSVKFEIYTRKNSVISKKIKQFFKPYLRVNPEIQLQFIDPIEQPSKVKNNAVSMQGEMVLTYADILKAGKVNITELSETAVINAIQRLLNNKDEWIVMAEGFGMRSIDDESVDGLSNWLIYLKKSGYHVARMPLNTSLILPDNVKLILLPHPTENLNAEMVDWLQQQKAKGIALWWLTDVDGESQNELELSLDIMQGAKTPIKGDKYADSLAKFPQHAITENFNQPVYIAEAREIIANQYQPFITTENNAVIATSKKWAKQRTVITGDVDFISNQYLNSAANKSLAIRITDWLLQHDDRVNVPVHINQHTQLYLSKTQLIVLSLVFLLFIPLLYLIIAIKQWRAGRG